MSEFIYEATLEVRQRGRLLSGFFPYNSTATIRDRGVVRKEKFASRAFKFAVETEPERQIHILIGHSFDRPVGARRAGSLDITDSAEGVAFEVRLPPESQRPQYLKDALLNVENGLLAGISPGFRVPPLADAERFIPEPGNPSVQIREIQEAVLIEMSLVARPAYEATEVELRHQANEEHAIAKIKDEDLWRLL